MRYAGVLDEMKCPSEFRTYDEHENRVRLDCQQFVGHAGSHCHGHWQDIMWSWRDDTADRW